MLHISSATDSAILVCHAPSVPTGVLSWITLMSLSQATAEGCPMQSDIACSLMTGHAGKLRDIWNDVFLSDIHHLSISRPYQGRSAQVCLVSSDLLCTHLALAGMCVSLYCELYCEVCVLQWVSV